MATSAAFLDAWTDIDTGRKGRRSTDAFSRKENLRWTKSLKLYRDALKGGPLVV